MRQRIPATIAIIAATFHDRYTFEADVNLQTSVNFNVSRSIKMDNFFHISKWKMIENRRWGWKGREEVDEDKSGN